MSGSRRRRRLVPVAAVLALTLVGTGWYLKANYDVMGIVEHRVDDWLYRYTSWFVASSEEIEAQIQASRTAGPHPETVDPAAGPLEVLPGNPRYFTDGTGRAVLLTGSHTWSNFQDNGSGYPPPEFDFEQYLDFLEAHGHNFCRLWVWEGSRWSVQTYEDDYWFHPDTPFQRTGPGEALDGLPRWDLTRFDPDYFDRLRQRVMAAGERGIYVSVMLFNGWSVASRKGASYAGNPWRGHPFNEANNINGVDGDTDDDGSGKEVHELGNPGTLAIQRAYVRRVIDAVNDLDNVLFEISNESHGASTEWQYAMIDFVKAYEAALAKQHPVGMTVELPGGVNEELFESNADWISPNRYADPPPAAGTKVIVSDTDHIWGIGGDRAWVWKSFTRGLNPIFMDGYDGAGYGVGGGGFDLDDPRWVDLRRNLGYARHVALKTDLASMTPKPELCSTGYCLARTGDDPEMVVYVPEGGTVSIHPPFVAAGLQIQWLDPGTGQLMNGSTAGGDTHQFVAPFEGDAVLLLHGTER